MEIVDKRMEVVDGRMEIVDERLKIILLLSKEIRKILKRSQQILVVFGIFGVVVFFVQSTKNDFHSLLIFVP